ncbi:hypothetical protein MBLNU457_5677t1 [Dothideomycetes sp. NU457]
MSSSPETPKLTPSFCFNTTALQDFLRISRSAVDDTISQNLNSLLTPSNKAFDPASTSSPQYRPRTRQQIPASSCQTFKDNVLFPSWQSRSDVLNYCAGVATSPDPNDPDHILRQEEDARARERVVNERLDPYSARYFPREPRTERLAGLLRNERMVEEIVRGRTWGIVKERCEESPGSNAVDQGWEDALNTWRKDGK